ARQGDPAKRSLALAEQWANVFGNETGDDKSIIHSGLQGLGADVVAILEGHRAALLKREHGLHVFRNAGQSPAFITYWIVAAQGVEVLAWMILDRHIAVEGIVCRGLIGEH